MTVKIGPLSVTMSKGGKDVRLLVAVTDNDAEHAPLVSVVTATVEPETELQLQPRDGTADILRIVEADKARRRKAKPPPVMRNAEVLEIEKRAKERVERGSRPSRPLPEPSFDLSYRRPKEGESVVHLVARDTK